MGILSKSKEWLETVKSWPGKIISSTRSKVGKLLGWEKNRDVLGAKFDKATGKPLAESIANHIGAGPVEEAERRAFASRRLKIRDLFGGIAEDTNRIDFSGEDAVIHLEDNFREQWTEDINRELSLDPPPIEKEDRLMVRGIVNKIDPGLELLSSQHPLTKLASRRTAYINQNPTSKDFVPASFLLYPPLQRGGKNGEYNETHTGLLSQTYGGRPRYDLTAEQRRRALKDGPQVEPGNNRYSWELLEKKSAYAERCETIQNMRRKFEYFPFELTISLTEEGYPRGGNPSDIHKLLVKKYNVQLTDPQWNQISLAYHTTGDRITVAGFLTRDQEQVPERIKKESLPEHFDDQYWFEKIPKEERAKGSEYWNIFHNGIFCSGYSIWNYYRIKSVLGAFESEGLDIKMTNASEIKDNEVYTRYEDVIEMTVSINGKTESMRLINGTDILLLPEESLILKATPFQTTESSATITQFLRVSEYLKRLEYLKKDHKIHYKSKLISGEAPEKKIKVRDDKGEEEKEKGFIF